MSDEPKAMKCMYCRTRTCVPTILPNHTVEFTIDGEKRPVVIENYDVIQCTRCGRRVIGDKGCDQLSEAYRRAGGVIRNPEAKGE